MERDSIIQKLTHRITQLEKDAGRRTNRSNALRQDLADRQEYLRRTGQANEAKRKR